MKSELPVSSSTPPALPCSSQVHCWARPPLPTWPPPLGRWSCKLEASIYTPKLNTPPPPRAVQTVIWYQIEHLQFRGALRGATAPVNLATLTRMLGVQATGSTAQTVAAIVEELLAEGAIHGAAKAGTFVPTYFARAQQRAAHDFYTQNGYIE